MDWQNKDGVGGTGDNEVAVAPQCQAPGSIVKFRIREASAESQIYTSQEDAEEGLGVKLDIRNDGNKNGIICKNQGQTCKDFKAKFCCKEGEKIYCQ